MRKGAGSGKKYGGGLGVWLKWQSIYCKQTNKKDGHPDILEWTSDFVVSRM